jgi:polyisoprenoid-binding protein YceI
MGGESTVQASGWKSGAYESCAVLCLAFFLLSTPASTRSQERAAPPEITLGLDPAQSKVHFSVDSTLHTVHGTFALQKGSTIHFDPETGKAGGEVAVDATTGESGNGARDNRMHKEILETRKYPDAIFRPRQIEGTVARRGACDVKVQGLMLLHGGEHEVTALAHAELADDHWTGTAKFEVPYLQWGIKDPSTWLLKVRPVVNVEIDMAGPVTSAK